MASDKLDMSLDDIIKKEGIRARRPGAPGGRGAAGGAGKTRSPVKGGSGGGGRFTGRGGRNAPYTRSGAGNAGGKWQHDRFSGSGGQGGGRGQPVHLLVSNLDYGVNDKDIRELFSEFGQLKKAAVHYDKSGRSQGTADVIYMDKSAAVQAMKQYNGVPLDGRPMKIEMAGATVVQQQPERSTQGQNRTRGGGGGGRGSGRGARGGGGGAGGRKEPPKKEDLDADLDAFISKA